MNNINTTITKEESCGQRIDSYLSKMPEIQNLNISRSRIQSLIEELNVFVNSENVVSSSYKTRMKDMIEVRIPNIKPFDLSPSNIPLNIVYEDADMLVINKQAGLVTHPGAGVVDNTLVNALLYHCKDLSGIGGIERPGIVHRLDKDTSGLMLVAKNDNSHHFLSETIRTREVKREYYAFVWGSVTPSAGKISGFIERCPINRLKMKMSTKGKDSLTHYQTIEEYLGRSISLIKCQLDTGRTHQIRVHLSSKKNPILGDSLYGGTSRNLSYSKYSEDICNLVNNFPRQALHSKSISFIHPRTKKTMQFNSSLSDDMKNLYENLIK